MTDPTTPRLLPPPPLDSPLSKEIFISFPEPSKEDATIKEKYQEDLRIELLVAKKQLTFYQKQNLLCIAELSKAKQHIETLNQQIFKLMVENAALTNKK